MSTKVVVSVLAAALAIAGVLAAIAIPAYHDRLYRSHVALAIGWARPAQEAIGSHFKQHKQLPERVEGLPPGLALGAGAVLTLTFAADAGAIAGTTLVFRPRADGDALRWDCTGGTLERRYRLPGCR